MSSEYSKAFVEGTGLYDMVASTAESSPAEVLAKMGISESEKIVLVVSHLIRFTVVLLTLDVICRTLEGAPKLALPGQQPFGQSIRIS